jgi:hypothetical protein
MLQKNSITSGVATVIPELQVQLQVQLLVASGI